MSTWMSTLARPKGSGSTSIPRRLNGRVMDVLYHSDESGPVDFDCSFPSRDSVIVHDRSFLMLIRQSPLSRTPPTGLPIIPGITAPATDAKNSRRYYDFVRQKSTTSSSSDYTDNDGEDNKDGPKSSHIPTAKSKGKKGVEKKSSLDADDDGVSVDDQFSMDSMESD